MVSFYDGLFAKMEAKHAHQYQRTMEVDVHRTEMTAEEKGDECVRRFMVLYNALMKSQYAPTLQQQRYLMSVFVCLLPKMYGVLFRDPAFRKKKLRRLGIKCISQIMLGSLPRQTGKSEITKVGASLAMLVIPFKWLCTAQKDDLGKELIEGISKHIRTFQKIVAEQNIVIELPRIDTVREGKNRVIVLWKNGEISVAQRTSCRRDRYVKKRDSDTTGDLVPHRSSITYLKNECNSVACVY